MNSSYAYTYIMSNAHNTVLYIGVTSNLRRRVCEHKEYHSPKSFTAKYNCTKLVYFEVFESSVSAIKREKRMKKLKRIEKEALIDQENPQRQDLYDSLF